MWLRCLRLLALCSIAAATNSGQLRGKVEDGSHVHARSTLMSLDGKSLKPNQAFSVPLIKGVVDSKRRAELLLQLKFMQRGLDSETSARHNRHQNDGNVDLEALLDRSTFSNEAVLNNLHALVGDGGRFADASVDNTQVTQASHAATSESTVDSAATGVDMDEEPLQAQILSQKRLATYYGEVHIGDQPFKVLFDTGSCEFWVPSVTCSQFTTPASRCAKHSQYDAKNSQSYHRFSETNKMLIQYLSGKIEGPLASDDVRIGALVVPGQVFGAAETIDVPLLDEVRWDGIMGLAYPTSALARKGVSPVFDNMMAHKLLHDNVFGYYLGPKGGTVTFGGIERKYIQPGSEFVYADVTHKGYWTVGITDIILTYASTGQVVTGLCRSQPGGMCRAIVDTGTYLVYGPAADVKGPLRDIQSSSCERVSSLPAITFVFAGAGSPSVTLQPKDYTLQFWVANANVPADECSQAQFEHPDGAGIDASRCSLDCVTGIAPDADTIWTLGQVFLRNFYAAFDRGRDRIGFARSVAPGSI